MLTSTSGYKLRTCIAKALQTRSEAIRRAITQYNTEAQKLSPPRPKLTWNEIVDYSFLAEFDLLRHSRSDIRLKPWADPLRREATIKYLRIQRAEEEINELNIQIRRVRTAIHDEAADMVNSLNRITCTDPLLGPEIAKRWQLRSDVNSIIISLLDRIEAMPEFSGIRGIGVRRRTDSTPPLSNGATFPEVPCSSNLSSSADAIIAENLADELAQIDIRDHDDILNEVEGVTDFVCRITD